MASFEEEAGKLNVKAVVITMILSAFGFLVALAWRDAIQQTIDLFVPKGEGLFYTYLAAVVVTLIAVAAAFALIRLQKMDIVPGERIRRAWKAPGQQEGQSAG